MAVPASQLHAVSSSDGDVIDAGLAMWWQVLDAWCNHLRSRGLSEETIDEYEGTIVRFFRRTKTTPGTLTEEQIEAYLASIKAKGATKQQIINGLKAYYRFCCRRSREIHAYNPASELWTKPPKYGKAKAFTAEQARAIIEASRRRRNPRRPWAITLMFETGARISSLAAVRPIDTGTKAGQRIHFEVAKGARPYSVPLTSTAAEAVRELLELMKPGQTTLVGCHKVTLGNWFHEAAEDAGMPEGWRNAHKARSTAGTAMYRRTRDPMKTKAFLNHADLSQIHRYVEEEEIDLTDGSLLDGLDSAG